MPKVSSFYGEVNKGEINNLTWKYEVTCLLNMDSYSEHQMLQAIRRCCKGRAGDKLRNLGTRTSIREVLKKFDSEYGSVETLESQY